MKKTIAMAALVGLLAVPLSQRGADAYPITPKPPLNIVSEAVTFTVDNVNRSKLKCPTDGQQYRIRGHLVGPRAAVQRGRAATLFLHGLELGEFFWTDGPNDISFVDRMAAAGQVSVVIDRLGYDSSGKPDGNGSCLGGQADIAHQIVDDLRAGSYETAGSSSSARFSKVALGGHSAGGLLTELTAISFNNVDAIVVASYSDTVLSDAGKAAAAANAQACTAGGQPTEGGAFPRAYASFPPSLDDFRKGFFLSASPADIDRIAEKRNLNPCGDTATFAAGAAVNAANIASITVPVLVIIGGQDALFPPPAGPTQKSLFTGSKNVRLVQLSPSSHAITVEAVAPQFARTIADFLGDVLS
jgi:pimeloyl-ACP methyl ester carboxylesterase